MMGSGVVAIVGRTNVGKSTLFNRLLKRRIAIVEGEPGVTRDRVYGICEWLGNTFSLVDTGGLFPPFVDTLTEQVKKQVELAIKEADVILFVIDLTEGLTPAEWEIAERLRKENKPVLIVANKADISRKKWRVTEEELYAFGWDDIFIISAAKGEGIGDLLDRIVSLLPPTQVLPPSLEDAIKIAIVGAVNVGKSSLLNAILQEDRVIVDRTPGTTRDAIDTPFEWMGRKFLLIDTAGIRKKRKAESLVEYFGIVRSMKAIQRADIAFLVLDASYGVRRVDLRVAGHVEEAGKGCIIVANKWDLIREGHKKKVQRAFKDLVRERMPFLAYAPVVFTSALKEEGINELLKKAVEVYDEYSKELALPESKEILKEAIKRHPAMKKGKQLRLYEVESGGAKPPSLLLYVNDTEIVSPEYSRYLVNRLREVFPLEGAPIRLKFLPKKKLKKPVGGKTA